MSFMYRIVIIEMDKKIPYTSGGILRVSTVDKKIYDQIVEDLDVSTVVRAINTPATKTEHVEEVS